MAENDDRIICACGAYAGRVHEYGANACRTYWHTPRLAPVKPFAPASPPPETQPDAAHARLVESIAFDAESPNA